MFGGPVRLTASGTPATEIEIQGGSALTELGLTAGTTAGAPAVVTGAGLAIVVLTADTLILEIDNGVHTITFPGGLISAQDVVDFIAPAASVTSTGLAIVSLAGDTLIIDIDNTGPLTVTFAG